MIMEEGHKSCLSIHQGMTKMYKDLKEHFSGVEWRKMWQNSYRHSWSVRKPRLNIKDLDVYYSSWTFLIESETIYRWTL